MYLMRNDWGRECLEAYHQIVPKSEPIEDWEKRIELYALCVIALPCPFVFLYNQSLGTDLKMTTRER